MKNWSLRRGAASFFLPERALAIGDVMLAQKIALETDEAAVLAIAKSFSPRLPSVPRAVHAALTRADHGRGRRL
ncbi:hypothetical protein ACVWZV_009983 [Bradyrhizobium sp. GM5.1]